jgi:hypothetical protein
MLKLLCTLVLMLFGSHTLAESRGFDLELGPYLSYIDYDESGGIAQSGRLSGIHARYSAYFPFLVTLIDLSYANGDVDYQGAGKINDIKNEVYALQAMIGRAFYFNDSYRVTPFLGLGYRRSAVDSRGEVSTISVAGVKSQQTYVHNPIGIEIQELMGESAWVVGGRFEYNIPLMAQNETVLGAVDTYQPVSVKHRKGRGYHFYLDFRRFLNNDGSGIVVEPFYKYWQLSGTNGNNLFGSTADHSSNEWGVALMVSF